MREFFAGYTLSSLEGLSDGAVQAVGIARVPVVDPLRVLLIGEVPAVVAVALCRALRLYRIV